MAAGKKSFHQRKKLKKNQKNKEIGLTVARKLIQTSAKHETVAATPRSSKRGRPKLPLNIRLQRQISYFFSHCQKRWRVAYHKFVRKCHQLFLAWGWQKGRGRKKLAWWIKFSRALQTFWQNLRKNLQKDFAFLPFLGRYCLRVFHLLRRPGRPKKPEKFSKKLFKPREVFSIGLFHLPRWHFRVSYFTSLLFSIAILYLSYQTYTQVIVDLPAPTDLSTKKQNLSSKIYDRNGNLLYSIYEDENRTLVPLSYVSPYLQDATIAIEDKDFYKHFGFSPQGIARAFLTNLTEDSTQGGSTITQQLVKNRLLTGEKTLTRKVKELLLSVLVERVYSKEQILEMYLNTVAYGGSTYGVEEAAQRYFHKSAHDVDLAEAALLAGLPQSPSVYSPFGSNPEKAYERQAEVLRRMVEDGYISTLQADEAKAEKLVFNQDRTAIEAPHFVMYVRKLLAEKYGENVIAQGGLEIRTSLDLNVQNLAQQTVTQEVQQIKNLHINNGAALVTNPKTGEILAMVGSINYFDFAADGQVNVTLRPRQPGSSIKPLTYAVAFEAGETPSSIIEDAPVVYQIPGSKPYAPKNYDGKFHGKVTIREALASSYNIPAVKTLNAVGINKVIDKAQALGISTWQDRSRFGLSLTLGAGEVTMVDMAELYSSFANTGYPVPLNPLLEVKNYKGETLYRNDCALDEKNCYGEQELSPLAAYLITDILSDNQARVPAFGQFSVLTIPNQQVAVKTGTTNNLKDNWTIGYTDDRLVATWVGNNDSSPMSYVASGITGASPIWNKIMIKLLDQNNPHHFALPDNLIKVAICATTMTLPCNACPKVSEEIFVKGTQPTQACNNESFLPQTASVH